MHLVSGAIFALLLLASCGGGGSNGPTGAGGASGGVGGGGGIRTGGSAGAGRGGASGGAGGEPITNNDAAAGGGGAVPPDVAMGSGDAPADVAVPDVAPPDTRADMTSPADAVASGPVTPVERNGRWVFEAAGITFEVDPRVGGRVTAFGFTGVNLLTDATVNLENWGSTFWTSPQSVWDWPPPPQIDNQPYAITSSTNALLLTGQPSPALGVGVVKTFAMDRADGTVRLTYKITNQRTTALSVAPWEVTRVANRGLAFFPTGPTIMRSPGATLPTTNVGGVTWFAYNAADIRADSKIYADALEGWLGYADGNTLFIKKFDDVPAAMLAPMQGDVEIYTNMLRSYIELENQGAYTRLAPQASLTWTVTWHLKRLPAGIMATAGNAALADFVRSVIR